MIGRRLVVAGFLLSALGSAISCRAAATADAARVRCASLRIDGARYRQCEIPPSRLNELTLRARDSLGQPYATIENLARAVAARRERLLFATNGGIYESIDSAAGLLVADGRSYSPLNELAGPANPCAVANFYCPPNAVFLVGARGAAVLATADYARLRDASVRLATQSGPMLVRDGKLARAFDPRSGSRLVRNGVGVRKDGTVVFAITDDGVSLHQFADAFLTTLECPNAMFLDGTISQLYDGSGAVPPPDYSFASIFAVVGQ